MSETTLPTRKKSVDAVTTTPAPPGAERRLNASVIFTEGGVILFLLLLVVTFSVLMPDKFFTIVNLQYILGAQAIPIIVGLAVLAPLIAGEFDLSVGGTVGIVSVYTAWSLGAGMPVPAVFATGLLIGIMIGVVNGFLVTKLGVSAFIATLGMGTILAGGNLFLSNGNVLYQGITDGATRIASTQFLGIPLVVFYAAFIALAFWYVLEWTPMGRYLRATGSGREAARLTGVNTQKWLFLSFVIAGGTAALAGFLLTAREGSAPPTVGANYLLPAYAAAFLGATTIHVGRFNVWGTVIGVFVLAVGITGLNLAGVAFWVPPVFNGVALLVAVSVAVFASRRGKTQAQAQ